MTDGEVKMTAVEEARLDWTTEHRRIYIESGGREGHIQDLTPVGGHPFTTTLLLETVGRKSGEARTVPLIYGCIDGHVVVVASKGGADVHPAWYLNIREMEAVTIQIATQAFRGRWHEADETEREGIWAFMERVYPPYRDYKAATDRTIPLVLIKPEQPVDLLQR